jgi:hypothetical protein
VIKVRAIRRDDAQSCTACGQANCAETVLEAGTRVVMQTRLCWDCSCALEGALVTYAGNGTIGVPSKKVTCLQCWDTHAMELGEKIVPCTFCPTPCQECRSGGTGPYCEKTPCNCNCHQKGRKR